MLQSDMLEAKTNQMKMTGYDLETVIAFLEYIYSHMNMFEVFDEEKCQIKLLRLAHQYEVGELLDVCVAYLSSNISMDSAMEVWNLAEELNIEAMKFSTGSVSQLMFKAGVFHILRCGSCKRITEKPALQCHCCGHLTALKSKSKVGFKFPA